MVHDTFTWVERGALVLLILEVVACGGRVENTGSASESAGGTAGGCTSGVAGGAAGECNSLLAGGGPNAAVGGSAGAPGGAGGGSAGGAPSAGGSGAGMGACTIYVGSEDCLTYPGGPDEYVCAEGKEQPPPGVTCNWYLESNLPAKGLSQFGCCEVAK